MVGTLIDIKRAVLRNSLTGTRLTWRRTGALAGLVLAAGTLSLATRRSIHPSAVGDLLGIAFALWALGWVLGPIWGGRSILRPEQFRLLPIPPRRLAFGLLGAAFVGVGAAVTLLAFSSLIVYGVRLGVRSAAVALPALLLQAVFVIVVSLSAAEAIGRLSRSRLGGALAGAGTAVMLVLIQSGWVVIERAGHVLDVGLPSRLTTIIRALPSGWSIVAVEAADRSDWTLVAGTLGGLAAATVLLFGAWSRVIGSPSVARTTIRGSRGVRLDRRLGTGGTGAVMAKELRAWVRDPTRTDLLVVGPAFALLTCLLPLIYHSRAGLPWAGPITALLAAATAANLYALDGTSLWMTLVSPGADRHDVRGRQWAWLAIFVPVTVVITVVSTAMSGQAWAWPWILALVASFLGGGAGLFVFVAVTQLAPGPDPRSRASMLDRGDAAGQGILTFWAGLVPAVPAVAVLLAGTVTNDDLLRWAGVLVGIGCGGALAWWLGRVAYRRLEARGPELLQLMRTGRNRRGVRSVSRPTVLHAMPDRAKALLFTCIWLGSIALVPQGIVPLGIKLTDGSQRVWFLALYLPAAWQWWTIAMMIFVGLLAYWIAFRIYRRHGHDPTPRTTS